MQPGDKGTVCSCDHLTFFTLLLVTILLPTALAHTLAVLPHLGGPSGAQGQLYLLPGKPRSQNQTQTWLRRAAAAQQSGYRVEMVPSLVQALEQ